MTTRFLFADVSKAVPPIELTAPTLAAAADQARPLLAARAAAGVLATFTVTDLDKKLHVMTLSVYGTAVPARKAPTATATAAVAVAPNAGATPTSTGALPATPESPSSRRGRRE